MLMTVAAKPAPRLRRVGLWFLVLLLFLAAGYTATVALLPAPAPTLDQVVFSGKVDTGESPQIDWPSSKQAAVGAVGFGVLARYGSEEQLPMASTAKAVAALAILKKHPLNIGEQGATITLGSSDVAIYNDYVAKGGSVVRVEAGEKISQYQALQAILIPSANNIAKSTVIWAFGSEAAYTDYANQMLKDTGINNTRITDASGLLATTVSTASDLVLIGEQALKNPVIAEIVAQSEATIPVAGKVISTNKVLGEAGINGIKTGHTNASGGCFLFAATREVGGEQIKIIGAIMAAPTIDAARAAAPGLIEAAYPIFTNTVGLASGQRVANVQAPWLEATIPITAEHIIDQVVWKGADLNLELSVMAATERSQVGTAKLGNETTAIVQQQDLPEPSFWWRFTHPLELLRGSGVF